MHEPQLGIGDFPNKMDRLKRIRTKGDREIEYRFAREIQAAFGYDSWVNFHAIIEKARENCAKIGNDPKNHFAETSKMVAIGSGAQREQMDFVLSRVGCYLVALNADAGKTEIAWAKAYFLVQARLNEAEKKSIEGAEERKRLREKLKESNRLLGGAAKAAGVINHAFFNNAGIQALYGMKMSDLKAKKGLRDKDEYWDRAGSLELSANEFKAQIVRESLSKKQIRGQAQAESEHARVARVVRKTVHEETGKYLENIPLEPSLKKLLKAGRQVAFPIGEELDPPSSVE